MPYVGSHVTDVDFRNFINRSLGYDNMLTLLVSNCHINLNGFIFALIFGSVAEVALPERFSVPVEIGFPFSPISTSSSLLLSLYFPSLLSSKGLEGMSLAVNGTARSMTLLYTMKGRKYPPIIYSTVPTSRPMRRPIPMETCYF